MTTRNRLSAGRSVGHSIDRTTTVTFTLDGKPYTGYAGDTLASALLANGVIRCGDSMYLGRPRGIMAAGVEEPNALVRIAARTRGHVDESMLPATTAELTEGLEASYLRGLGRLDPRTDEAYYDRKHVHTDVLVVGAGPAGLTAARHAAASGARVILRTSNHSQADHCSPPGTRSSTARRPRSGWRRLQRNWQLRGRSPICSAPPSSAAMTATTSSPSSDGPTTFLPPRVRVCPASGSGMSGRNRWYSPQGPTNALSCSRTTTDRASCWLPRYARTSTATR